MPNSVTILVRAKDEASAEIEKVKTRLNAVASSAGFKSIVQGVGMGIGASAWGMVQNAMAGAVDTLGELMKAGMDEEAGQKRLSAALTANVHNWDGNTDAIQRGIDARVSMGFSDDDLRDSLTRLLPITKDVAQAQNVQAAAMDLARYKGIGLVDASLAIGKAMEGNKKMLKELGINVADVADAQQTLAAVQTAVAGQAAAYMDSMAGRMDAAAARVDQKKQEIGAWLDQQASSAILGLDYATFAPEQYGYSWWSDESTRMQEYATVQAKLAQGAKGAADIIRGDLGAALQDTGDGMAVLQAATGRYGGTVAADLIPKVKAAASAADDSAAAFHRMTARYDAMAANLAHSSDMKELPLRIAVAKDEVVAAQKDLEKARTRAEKDAAALRLQQAKDELAALRLELSSKTQIDAVERASKGLGAAMARGISEGFTSATGRLNIDVRAVVHAGAKALGGTVDQSGIYRVGETRPEDVYLPAGSYVSPNTARASSGGAPVQLLIQLDGETIARKVDQRLYWRAQRAPS